MADSPMLNTDGPLGLTIKLDGVELADEVAVLSVRVNKGLNQIPEAVVMLADGSVVEQEFPLTDADDAVPGTQVEIAAFYGANQAQTLFKGIVTATQLRVRSGEGGQLELTCHDRAIALTGLRKTAARNQCTDADVMRALASNAGLAADIAATAGPKTDIVQYECADWDFLRLLADRNGQVLVVDDASITSEVPTSTKPAALTVTLGMDILDFDARIDATPLETDVSVAGWDPAVQQVASVSEPASGAGQWGDSRLAKLASVSGDRTRSATLPYAQGQSSLADVARSRAGRVGLAAIQGRCTYTGCATAGPGDTVELKGVGNRAGGVAFVSAVSHDIAEGRWTTTAHLGLSQAWRSDGFGVPGPAAGGVTAPVHGLHVASVLAIVADDSNPYSDASMVKVSLPLIGDRPAELWARYAQPYATKNAGVHFLPEIGDEVIVGFLSADPGAPVVLGALHSATRPRSNPATENNALKMLMTASGLAITFDDDTRALSMKTPGGHSIELSDDAKTATVTDHNGNRIEMSDTGIAIESMGALDLKAAQAITLSSADGNVSISSSGGDVSIAGNNIQASAVNETTMKGGVRAEISAGGETTVKGAMVKIN